MCHELKLKLLSSIGDDSVGDRLPAKEGCTTTRVSRAGDGLSGDSVVLAPAAAEGEVCGAAMGSEGIGLTAEVPETAAEAVSRCARLVGTTEISSICD